MKCNVNFLLDSKKKKKNCKYSFNSVLNQHLKINNKTNVAEIL